MPFVRIMIPFMAGIWCARYLDALPVMAWGLTGTCLLMTWLFLGRLSPGLVWRLDPLRGVMVILCLFVAGGLTLNGKRKAREFSEQSIPPGVQPKAWICTLEESPQRKRNSFRALVSMEIITSGRQVLSGGRGMVYFPADSVSKLPGIGSRIITQVAPEPLKGPDYPGGFDAAEYFGRQGIGYRTFLRPGQWCTVDSGRVPWLDKRLEQIKSKVLGTLGKHIYDPAALGLAEALLIGYRNDLDDRLSDAYTETGVIHVIAISGLHIGVIFNLLSGLLNLLLRGRKLRWLATTCALAGIWGFGLLAGGGPSVMRSVCMFSIIGIGQQVTGREGNGLNTLAAVACLMLAIQPWWLWDLGFQLSFTAVAGLMLFYRPVLGLLPIKNIAALKIWEMTAVTLAAQILTTPLLLHTFGRFPVFFLITNLVAIPVSTLILLGELALCLLAPIHEGMAQGCGEGITIMIRALNAYIFRMESIPFGILEQIHLSAGEMILIYLCIICYCGWWLHRKAAWLMATLLCMMLAGAWQAWINADRDRQQILVVMPLARTRLLMLVDGRRCQWLISQFGRIDHRQIRMAMRATAHHYGIQHQQMDTLPATGHFDLHWKGVQVRLLGEHGYTTDTSILADTDLIVLSGNGPARTEEIMKQAPRADWIADGTNSVWKILQWEAASKRLPLRLHSTRRSGAFIRRIR